MDCHRLLEEILMIRLARLLRQHRPQAAPRLLVERLNRADQRVFLRGRPHPLAVDAHPPSRLGFRLARPRRRVMRSRAMALTRRNL